MSLVGTPTIPVTQSESFVSRTKIQLLAGLVIVFVNFMSISSILDSPYLGDDSWRESTIRGMALLANKSLFEICWGTLKDYADSGRWYPLVIYYFPVFFYLDQKVYKTLTLLFTIFNVITFGYIVRLLTSSRSAGLLAMTLPPLFFQLRFYNDPILSYYFLMQIEFSLITLSLIFFLLHLETSRRIPMYLSVLAFAACLLVYESAVVFCILPASAAYFYRKKRVLKTLEIAWPFLIVSLLNIAILFFVRLKFGVHYEGVRLSLAPFAWLTTFCKQMFSAVPLSYYLTSDSLWKALDYSRDQFSTNLLIVALVWALAWLLVSYRLMNRDKGNNRNSMSLLLVLGFALWVFPSGLVAFSAKYQTELKWGVGYLPVYWADFGFMLITVAGIMWFYDRIRGFRSEAKFAAVAVLALFGSLVCGINYRNNGVVVERYNYAEHYPRRIMENALHCGFFDPVPQFSYLLCGEPTHSWDNPPFYRLHSGLTIQVVRPEGFDPSKELGVISILDAFKGLRVPGSPNIYDCNGMQKREALFAGYQMDFKGLGWPILCPVEAKRVAGRKTSVFYLKYEAESKDMGYAVLAKVSALKTINGVVSALSCNDVYVYVGIPAEDRHRGFIFSGACVDDSLRRTGEFSFRDTDLGLTSSGFHGRIYHVRRSMPSENIDPKSSVVVFTSIVPPQELK
jgi:hypothetical protein